MSAPTCVCAGHCRRADLQVIGYASVSVTYASDGAGASAAHVARLCMTLSTVAAINPSPEAACAADDAGTVELDG